MTVRIVGANLRDLSYIASNMRPDDRVEIECQLDVWNSTEIAAMSLGEHAYMAEIDGNPEVGFGAARMRRADASYWTAWSWGTPRIARAVPHITRFVRRVMIPAIYEVGGQRVEARAMASNRIACKWLKAMGAHERCDLPCYGKGGELFKLFDWVREDWQHVLEQTEDPAAEAAANAPDTGRRRRSQPRAA